MKVFSSPIKNIAYTGYRLATPILDPIDFVKGIVGYVRYIKELLEYKIKDPSSKIRLIDLFPLVKETSSFTPFDAQYYHQGIWLLKHILKRKPILHVDIASKYELSGYISLITKSEFVDLRPIDTKLKNLSIKRGDILNLPYKADSLPSVSCLHVIEHIGLGRYGDPIDPKGSVKACKELMRVTKKGGFLYLTTPIGKPRICFNAHRIHSPMNIIELMKPLRMIEFSIVDDDGNLKEHVDPKKYINQHYACGMFIFKK